jgi:pathogenesis-related protein 1
MKRHYLFAILLFGMLLSLAAWAADLPATKLTDADIKQLVDAHNKARAEVGSPPLEWSDEIARHAQVWADELAKTGKFYHSPDGTYGQNLAEAHNVDQFVSMWLKEKARYKGEVLAPENVKSFGHYTQVVWKASTKFGCGKSKTPDGFVWVCEYDPPGNFMDETAY